MEERLNKWLDSLTPEQLKKVAHDCVTELELVETICFPEDVNTPYWEVNGEGVDGTEINWE